MSGSMIILNYHDGAATVYLTETPDGATLSWLLVGYVYEGVDVFLDVPLSVPEVDELTALEPPWNLQEWLWPMVGRPASLRFHSWHQTNGWQIPIQMPVQFGISEVYPWLRPLRDGSWYQATGSGE